MTMPDGTYMPLYWCDDDLPAFYVWGHVSPCQAREIVAANEDMPVGSQRVRHRYMRWSWPDTYARSEGLDRMAVLYDEPGRGRFKVTEVDAGEN